MSLNWVTNSTYSSGNLCQTLQKNVSWRERRILSRKITLLRRALQMTSKRKMMAMMTNKKREKEERIKSKKKDSRVWKWFSKTHFFLFFLVIVLYLFDILKNKIISKKLRPSRWPPRASSFVSFGVFVAGICVQYFKRSWTEAKSAHFMEKNESCAKHCKWCRRGKWCQWWRPNGGG